ncbi:hypothetical protein DUNSADRAFT_10965 [Dunaliella salina]|uniref:Encoded protein n=1 Tax=Dunaliella salina TaxID=3046 RepID=A0ABQ7GEE4_DUNSA|nr:hypothetical protein DUNSADRAFT_10965 [Dunaliella salina]|eukprot:KAF5832978.1 hypothetical protein DUNSADRAFT_10965 [Dunaliella salina]
MASRALSNAMRGVFASSLKLAAFHAAFTWLTLKACGTHLTHLLTLVSMLVSVLPLLPCWVAVLPPAFELAMSSSGACRVVCSTWERQPKHSACDGLRACGKA